jgi:hypothetical protein
MRRRTVLAGVAGLASTAGCLRVLADETVRVRVKRTPEGDAADAARHCALGASFVSDHPTLERVVTAAASAPRDEWVTEDVDVETGRALAEALHEHCSAVGGVYHYDGASFLVEVGDDDESLFPGTTTGSEAIRGVHPDTRS